MGKITVNPDVQGAGEFPVWAEGEVDFEVTRIEERRSSKGQAMLNVELVPQGEVLDERGVAIEKPGRIFDNIMVDPVGTKNGGQVSFLRPFIEACGLTWGDFDTDQLQGAKVRAKVIIGEYNGRRRNEIGRYVKA